MANTVPSPTVYTPTVGAVSAQVIPANLTRRGLFVFNPGNVVIWICPATNNAGMAVPAVIGGAGSIPIQPQQGLMLGDDGSTPPFTNALVAIASPGGQPFTIWEFYQ